MLGDTAKGAQFLNEIKDSFVAQLKAATHESLISCPTYAHSLEEFVTVLSVVCHACFSGLSEAKSEKCCRRTSPENCET